MADKLPDSQRRVKRVVRRKKPEPSIVESTLGVAMSYIWSDVILPQIKDTLFETVTEGAQHMIYRESMGRPAPRRSRARTRGGKTDYNASSRPRRSGKRRRSFRDEILDSRQDAQRALDNLQGALEEYGVVSLADVYDAIGVTSTDFSDNNWGWHDLKGARILRGQFGFHLDLPDPQPLD